MLVAISPHYYFPTDKGWKFEGGLEKLMHKIGMFNRKGPLSMEHQIVGLGTVDLVRTGHDGFSVLDVRLVLLQPVGA